MSTVIKVLLHEEKNHIFQIYQFLLNGQWMICSCGRSKEDQIYNIEFVFNILNMKCGYIYLYILQYI